MTMIRAPWFLLSDPLSAQLKNRILGRWARQWRVISELVVVAKKHTQLVKWSNTAFVARFHHLIPERFESQRARCETVEIK